MKERYTLVILAAGMGSRFGGLKQLHALGPDDSTLLDYSLFDAQRAGFTDFVFVIRPELEEDFERQVASRFGNRLKYCYAYQKADELPVELANQPERTKPWGTGHALWAARAVVDRPFGLINADDFYGKGAYQTLIKGLKEAEAKAGEVDQAVLVSYPLNHTLSPHGPVSRGVCVVNNGSLQQLTEFTKIERQGDDRIMGQCEGDEQELAPSTPVSLNCFGFTPRFFDLLQDELKTFLQTPDRDLSKGEFYLPSAVMAGVKQGKLEVAVPSTDSPWFGMTYREDLPQVQAKLNELIAQGVYPSELWGREAHPGIE
ncbi:MAG: NTP transferase domain-containing protein [Verrucomicrobiota bacterium JB022]|nr:NTP transferase domain-containing protein [Verrucomicrobiota bacterium JB022]